MSLVDNFDPWPFHPRKQTVPLDLLPGVLPALVSMKRGSIPHTSIRSTGRKTIENTRQDRDFMNYYLLKSIQSKNGQ